MDLGTDIRARGATAEKGDDPNRAHSEQQCHAALEAKP